MGRSLKKGPFIDRPPPREGGGDESREREEGHQDLVAPLDRDSRDGGPHDRGAQREEVHPGVHHREHGRPQARRVRADAARSRATRPKAEKAAQMRRGGDGGAGGRRRRGGGGSAVAARERVMIEAQATARYIRTSAQKAGLVLRSDSRHATSRRRSRRCSSRARSIARDIEKVLRSAIANAQQKRRLRRRRRPAVRGGVLRQSGPEHEAHPPGPDGPGVSRRQAHGAPDGGGRRAAGEGRRRRQRGRARRAAGERRRPTAKRSQAAKAAK